MTKRDATFRGKPSEAPIESSRGRVGYRKDAIFHGVSSDSDAQSEPKKRK